MKTEKTVQKIFIITFLTIITFFMITTLLNNEKVSDVERRELNTFPKFKIENLVKKSYYDDLTSAFQDQLELRQYLIKGYFLFQFQRYYGDAVKGKNNQLYSAEQAKPSNDYYKNLKKQIENINTKNKELNAKLIFLSIPRKDAYMTKELPKTYTSSINIYTKQVEITKQTLDSDITFINAYDVFKKSGIYNCYYSNDHHTTPKCAYELYK